MQDESIDELQSRIKSSIQGKSFFLVLDDVWQSDIWTNLLRIPLQAAATGIVLLTTRFDTIAIETGADHTHRVDLLSMDVGWELLWRSMGIKDEKEVQNVQDLGIDIVRRCGGLPLAIKVIARVLASKDPTENEWKKILGKDAWSMTKLPSEITSALYLSYEELPHHLKQCFVYCALYPEDSVIYRDDIIRMWVAEGFIDEKDGYLLEDTTEEYYYELMYRNLIHETYFEDAIINIEKTFDMLIPAHNLEDLSFVNFFGRRFPTWLGTAAHLPSLTYLKLINCKSCVHLPPIGQLPNLKFLKIDGATAVTKIGPEFVGHGVDNLRFTEAVGFPRLETLIIESMPNWEEWSFVAEE